MLRRWLSTVGGLVAAAALLLTPAAGQARHWGWGGWGWGGYRGFGWGAYRGLGWYGGYRGLGWGYYPRYYGRYWGGFYPYGVGYYGYYPAYYGSWYYPSYYGSLYYPSYYGSSYYPGFVSSSTYYPTYAYGTTLGYTPSYTYGNLSTSGYYDGGTLPANRAMVRVEVPRADAEVWIDGQATQQRGTDRLFETPALTTGKSYHYDVRARWTENGQTFDRTRTVHFRPGERVTVDFRQPASQGEGGTK